MVFGGEEGQALLFEFFEFVVEDFFGGGGLWLVGFFLLGEFADLGLSFGDLVFEVEFLFFDEFEALFKLLVQVLILEVPVIVDFLNLSLLLPHHCSYPALQLVYSRRQFVHILLLIFTILLKIGFQRLQVLSLVPEFVHLMLSVD